MSDTIPIKGDDLWVKVVEMLQQNWASIEPEEDGVRVYFINDTSQVFDRMPFESAADAEAALARNGFRRFRDALDLQRFLRALAPPFREGSHPNGPIYSSGRFWR
jgi:hypothetical protein